MGVFRFTQMPLQRSNRAQMPTRKKLRPISTETKLRRGLPGNLLSGLLAQLDIPIRQIEKVLPAIVILGAEIHLNKRPPLRPLRLADQMHASFCRRAIGFFGITLNAGAHDVFPGGRPSPIARHDVIQIQVFTVKKFAAVLAGIVIALENVVAGELHLFFRHAIEQHQDDHARHPNAKGDRVNAFRVRLFLGKIMPGLEVVGLERAVVRVQHHLSMSLEKQSKSAASGANIDRLPQPVENQNLLVQKGIHTSAGLSCGGT